jgi:DNA primase
MLKSLAVNEVACRLGLPILRKTNQEMTRCMSPSHKGEDENPSLNLNADKPDYRGMFYCFVCGDKGSALDLVMRSKRLSIGEACDWLGEEFNIPKPRARMPLPPEAVDYWSKHGMDVNDLPRDKIYYNERFYGGAWMFKHPLAKKWVGRLMHPTDGRKYRNMKGASLDIFKMGPDQPKTLIWCEGMSDAIAVHHHTGMAAWSGTCGAGSFPLSHRMAFSDVDEVCIIPDQDEAGKQGAERTAAILKGVCKEVYIVDLPEGKDCGDFFALGHTGKEFVNLINDARPNKSTLRGLFKATSAA